MNKPFCNCDRETDNWKLIKRLTDCGLWNQNSFDTFNSFSFTRTNCWQSEFFASWQVPGIEILWTARLTVDCGIANKFDEGNQFLNGCELKIFESFFIATTMLTSDRTWTRLRAAANKVLVPGGGFVGHWSSARSIYIRAVGQGAGVKSPPVTSTNVAGNAAGQSRYTNEWRSTSWESPLGQGINFEINWWRWTKW